MHPAPAGRENSRLGIKLLQAHRDSRGIDDSLAVFERDRRHHDLARGEDQFLALQVVNLDDFELDALEREQLAHLGAKWTAEKLVELRRHHRVPMFFSPPPPARAKYRRDQARRSRRARRPPPRVLPP